jgi:imidazolonepropionase-like amidohydrolase
MHRRQLSEFSLRSEVVPNADLLRSATTVAAKLLRIDDRVGKIAEGFAADIIAFRGDPLADISVLANLQANLRFVMKGGAVMVDAGEGA